LGTRVILNVLCFALLEVGANMSKNEYISDNILFEQDLSPLLLDNNEN
jgi:hypothetical protein